MPNRSIAIRTSVAAGRAAPHAQARVDCAPLNVTNSLKEPPRTAHFQRALTQNLNSLHGTRENQCTTC
jgi:hypothetical protein